MSASNPHAPARFPDQLTRQRLITWFTQYATNPGVEIEARIRRITGHGGPSDPSVSQLGFESLLANLKSNTGWSKPPAEEETCDYMHASRVRETRRRNGAPSFMRKVKKEQLTVQVSPELEVRFAVAEEVACPATSEADAVTSVRFKYRYTFVHKRLFSFELTKVHDGPTAELARQSPIRLARRGLARAVTRDVD